MLKVADPQRSRLVACPATPDWLLADTQFTPCGAFSMEVTVKGRTRQRSTELLLQDAIDHHIASSRLFLLKFNSSLQQRLLFPAGTATVTAWAAERPLNSFIPQSLPPTSEGAYRNPFLLPVGQ